jgi:hypothetical protein
MQKVKRGSQVRLKGCGEVVTIAPWFRKISGERSDLPGYHCVKTTDGRRFIVHESDFDAVKVREGWAHFSGARASGYVMDEA